MKKISRIVVESIELRVIEGDQRRWCEIFESNKWNRLSVLKLHQLSFDKGVYGWLNQHLNSTGNIQKLPDNENESLEQNNDVENQKPKLSIFTTFLRNFFLNKKKPQVLTPACMTMFCPNCGASEQSPETYCKKCGTYLRDASFRGWLLGGNNPGNAAVAIVISSVFIAILCVCISLLIVKSMNSRDLAYLKYAFGLCWLIVGFSIPISLMGFRLWRKMRLAQSSVNESALANNSTGAAASSEQPTKQLPVTESSGDAATELLNLPTREFDERK